MDDNNRRADGPDGEEGKILLHWKVSAFLPIRDEQEPRFIQETLYAQDFRRDADVRSYWSIPERLVDLRWVTARQAMDSAQFEETADAGFDDYFVIECDLYRIVSAIGRWSGSCGQNIEKAKRELDSQQALEEIYSRDRGFLQECASRWEQSSPPIFSTEALRRLLRITEVLLSPDTPVGRRSRLRVVTMQLQQSCLLALQEGAEDYSAPVYEQVVEFSRRTLYFLEDFAWREPRGATLKLRKLEKSIQKIVKNWSPAGKDPQSRAYQRSIWNGLQQAANAVCGEINDTGQPGAFSAAALLQRVKRAVKLLGLSKQPGAKLWKDYTKDRGRCVALLDIDGSRTVAFSGFLDCEDPQAESMLSSIDSQTTAQMIHDFRLVCRTLRSNLAVLSTGVVNRMHRSKLDSMCRMRIHGPLRRELSRKFGISFLKESYACCERKILAEIAPQGCANVSASLYVKFEPCPNCCGVLWRWMGTNGIRLTLDVLAK